MTTRVESLLVDFATGAARSPYVAEAKSAEIAPWIVLFIEYI